MNTKHPRDPFHGITLAKMLDVLLAHHGWDALGKKIPIRCFTSNPSISSSLKFLRRTTWAREKVEDLYLGYLIETKPGPELDPPKNEGKPAEAPEAQWSCDI